MRFHRCTPLYQTKPTACFNILRVATSTNVKIIKLTDNTAQNNMVQVVSAAVSIVDYTATWVESLFLPVVTGGATWGRGRSGVGGSRSECQLRIPVTKSGEWMRADVMLHQTRPLLRALWNAARTERNAISSENFMNQTLIRGHAERSPVKAKQKIAVGTW